MHVHRLHHGVCTTALTYGEREFVLRAVPGTQHTQRRATGNLERVVVGPLVHALHDCRHNTSMDSLRLPPFGTCGTFVVFASDPSHEALARVDMRKCVSWASKALNRGLQVIGRLDEVILAGVQRNIALPEHVVRMVQLLQLALELLDFPVLLRLPALESRMIFFSGVRLQCMLAIDGHVGGVQGVRLLRRGLRPRLCSNLAPPTGAVEQPTAAPLRTGWRLQPGGGLLQSWFFWIRCRDGIALVLLFFAITRLRRHGGLPAGAAQGDPHASAHE
mmetsp:Transcript_125253/g.359752  ORF Transcript_125253/g.359752 Transcript_125253/m.359752 type:complete len:275 (+) Transcript_125253:798-1622(+)